MRYITPILLFILLIGCPKPDEKLDPAICDDGYHPCGPDSQDCCLDTTSSAFSWTIDTIGTFRTILRDVEYVNDNNIWVVGTINHMIPDSNGELTIREDFNLAHWDGVEWEMSYAYYGSVELFSITYFSDDDIWVTSHSFPLHWDGMEWTLYHLQNMGLSVSAGKSSWGTSSDDIYFVGDGGSIVHYDGISFTKIESGTGRNLNSISGTPNGEYIFITGTNADKGSTILQLHNSEISVIYQGEDELSLPAGTPRSISVLGDTVYFASGEGIWKFNYITNASSRIVEAGTYESILPSSIITSTPNDIFMCGSRSEFIHFNGVHWTSDFSVWGQFGYSGVGSYGMDVKGDDVVIVGYVEGWQKGLIAHGRRN